MMKKWLSLLLALALLLAAGMVSFAEETDEGNDVDDSVEFPTDMDEEQKLEDTVVTEVRPLALGDEGDDVKFLQLRLQSLYYFSGQPDGKYGEDTKAAVRKFQEDNKSRGLQITGDADVDTQVMLASTKYRGLKYGSTGEDVKDLQIRLTALGYYKGKISGDFLEGTQNGIRRFQKNNNLESTGEADPLTQETLYSSTAIGNYDVEEPTATPFSDSAWYMVDESDTGVPMPETPVLFEKELKRDSRGDAVKKLQERMKLLGYFDGSITGNYQDKTISAVKKIQKQNGMKVTGRTDEETWNLIFNNPGIVMPDATPKPEPTKEPTPFAITVDVTNQVVSVYTRDEEGNYTIPVRQMLCSSGKVGTDSPVGDWVLNGRKARWCYFPKWGDYARYWTRINASVAFHSPIYSAVSVKAIKEGSYEMLGNRASHGCIRLALADAKWIYDNVGAGTVVSIRTDLPKDEELKTALKAVKPKHSYDSPIATTPEPEYNRYVTPQLKRALKYKDDGEAVYWVQCRLKELGYYTTKCTGRMLNRTVAAVKEFQKDHGYSQSGSVNQELIEAMAAAEKITPEPQLTPAPPPAD
ncbi:MAG: peptidoglycan-binding protein [Clostridia bacterium]|nr:peptidoglycan-binding protein [Clostridia bacterium]